jgi:hypothetical protein
MVATLDDTKRSAIAQLIIVAVLLELGCVDKFDSS